MIQIDGLDMRETLRRIVASWEASGQTAADLCRRSGVGQAQLVRALADYGPVPKADLVWDVAAGAGLKVAVTLAPDDNK